MNKLSSYLQPACLLCLLGVAPCTHAEQAAPWAAFAKGLVTSKASLLRRPATSPGYLARPRAVANDASYWLLAM